MTMDDMIPLEGGDGFSVYSIIFIELAAVEEMGLITPFLDEELLKALNCLHDGHGTEFPHVA